MEIARSGLGDAQVRSLLRQTQTPGEVQWCVLGHTPRTQYTQLTMKFGFVEKRVAPQKVDLHQAHYETPPHRHALVKLQLEPIGHSWTLNSPQRIAQSANSLLVTLKHVHDRGFVHCDVRADNIVEIPGGWLLIDWEMAGKSGAEVFLDSLAAPPGVHRGSQWLASHDLWQMGKLIIDQLCGESPALAAFAEQLQSADITDAIALETLKQTVAEL